MIAKITVTGVVLIASMVALSQALADTSSFKMTTDVPEAITTPNEIDTSIGTLEFFDGVPSGATVDALYDYVDRARAVHAYVVGLPLVAMRALDVGGKAAGSDAANTFLIADKMLDSMPLVLTANTSTLYTWSFLDLERDGPTVIDLPKGMLGVLNDGAFRYLADLGVAGQDKGEGGKYLVLPPGFDGDAPDGYFTVQSHTNAVWVFMRGFVKDGLDAAVQNIKGTLNAYPLAEAGDPPAAEFISMSELAGYNTIPPNDFSFYEMLDDVIQSEPADIVSSDRLGIFASIGIVKGQDFAPDARMREILTDAVAIGNAYARANTVFPRDPRQRIYGGRSEWVMGYAGKDTGFGADGAAAFDAQL